MAKKLTLFFVIALSGKARLDVKSSHDVPWTNHSFVLPTVTALRKRIEAASFLLGVGKLAAVPCLRELVYSIRHLRRFFD